MQSYISLHNHTEYSKLDGKSRPKELVKAVKDFGMDAVAVTEHRNMDSLIPFYKACQAEGIKSIIACEIEETEDRLLHSRNKRKELGHENNHLVLLAKNDQGYKNLLKIVSDAATNGFFDKKERTEFDFIKDNNLGKGLYASTACLAGRIPRLLLKGQLDLAEMMINQIAGLFDQLFLELQPHDMAEQQIVNNGLITLAQRTNLPLIVTCDSHFIKPEEKDIHDTLICIQTGQDKYDPNRRFKFDEGNRIHLWTPEDMWNWVKEKGYPEECITNTIQIAKDCNVTVPLGQRFLPDYDVPQDHTPESFLTEWAKANLNKYLIRHPELDQIVYKQRLDYELGVINGKGYASYFLILADIVNFCHQSSIPVGPGRGSSAGCLVAFMLGITNLDPIVHGLVFERFLNPERESMPDIDSDLCYDRRGEVIEYCKKKYQHVAQISTYMTMKLRAVTKDVMRAYGIHHTVADDLVKLIPLKINQKDPTIKMIEELESDLHGELATKVGPESTKKIVKDWQQFLQEICKYPLELERDIRALEGLVRGSGIHAGGVLLAPGPLEEYGVVKQGSETAVIPLISFNMEDIDEVGMLKVDLLGSRTVTVIDKAARNAGIDADKIPLDDLKTWRAYREGHNHAIFQLNGGGITEYCKQMKPEKFQELVDLVAIYRPGPLEGLMDTGNTMAEQYIINKEDPSQITYPHPDAKPILNKSKGIVLYQEQCMQIAQKFAGYSLGGADLMRKAIGKKKAELMKSLRHEFIYGSNNEDGSVNVPGCIRNGYLEDVGKYLFDLIERFAGYGFNIAHSACYALNSYRTQYLKTHYPVEFMQAVLDSEATNLEKITKNLKECKRLGVKILPPDINKSDIGFTVEIISDGSKAIRYGLLAVKGMGEKHIVAIKANRPFASLTEVNNKVSGRELNKNLVASLVKVGAFDNLYPEMDRYEMLNEYHFTVKRFKEAPPGVDKPKNTEALRFDLDKWEQKINLEWEKELLGSYVSGHPLDWLPCPRLEFIPPGANCEVGGQVKSIRTHIIQNGKSKGQEMCFLTVETAEEFIDVTVFSEVYTKHKNNCKERKQIIVRGKKDRQRDCIIANEIVQASRSKTAKKQKEVVLMPILPEDFYDTNTPQEPISKERIEYQKKQDAIRTLLSQYG